MKEKMNKKPLTAHVENARLLKEAKLTPAERLDLYALVGHIDDEEGSNDGLTLNMYLNGDRNWKEDFKKIFKREAGTLKKAYKLEKIKKVVIK